MGHTCRNWVLLVPPTSVKASGVTRQKWCHQAKVVSPVKSGVTRQVVSPGKWCHQASGVKASGVQASGVTRQVVSPGSARGTAWAGTAWAQAL